MSDTAIATIEELFKKYANLLQFEEGGPEYFIDEEDFEITMKQFAIAHVEAALKAASEKANIKEWLNGDPMFGEVKVGVNKQSILTAYPFENIK